MLHASCYWSGKNTIILMNFLNALQRFEFYLIQPEQSKKG